VFSLLLSSRTVRIAFLGGGQQVDANGALRLIGTLAADSVVLGFVASGFALFGCVRLRAAPCGLVQPVREPGAASHRRTAGARVAGGGLRAAVVRVGQRECWVGAVAAAHPTKRLADRSAVRSAGITRRVWTWTDATGRCAGSYVSSRPPACSPGRPSWPRSTSCSSPSGRRTTPRAEDGLDGELLLLSR
jgi:hypothetical protein